MGSPSKVQDYSWGGMSESRSQKQADKNLDRMTGQINQTESKLENLMQARPGYDFAYASPEFQKMRQEIAAGGPLSQYEEARNLLGLQSRQNIDRQTSDLAGQQATAYSQLAMGGGLSSGARERVAQGGAQANLLARQGLRSDTQTQYADLSQKEAAEKIQMQQQIANIAAQEEQRRQQAEMDRWKTEMETRASIEKSRQQANATAASSCFAPGTMVTMEDGTAKRIEHIKIGDRVKLGGEVYCTQKAKYEHTCYEYGEGNFITGQHAVYEDGAWVRVKDAKHAKAIPYKLSCVYNIATTNHRVVVNGVLFSDFHETDGYEFLSDEESLVRMNQEHAEIIKEYDEQPRA